MAAEYQAASRDRVTRAMTDTEVRPLLVLRRDNLKRKRTVNTLRRCLIPVSTRNWSEVPPVIKLWWRLLVYLRGDIVRI